VRSPFTPKPADTPPLNVRHAQTGERLAIVMRATTAKVFEVMATIVIKARNLVVIKNLDKMIVKLSAEELEEMVER
jgi:diphthamide synthase subunit DPH2